MKTNSEYKNFAAAALSGNWVKGAVAFLIYIATYVALNVVITGIVGGDSENSELSSGISNLVSILLLPLIWGFAVFFLSLYRGQTPSYGSLFDGFRTNYLKYLGTMLLMYIYMFLWTLLLIVPGIIKAYSYSMTCYVMKDNPSLQYNAAIEESMRLMQGHKMQLFLLDLSMIGWAILSCLTIGIGFFFLVPYNQTAHAAFYEDLKAGAASDGTRPEVSQADFEEVR